MASAGYVPLASFVLEPGDILCKYFFAKDPVSHVIQVGQAVTKGTKHANIVHAAIALDETYVIEASGEGVIKNKISDNLKHGYMYKVFRYKNADVAQLAASKAESKLNKKYGFGKAFKSLFKGGKHVDIEEQPLLGSTQLFCSELAVACYNELAYDGNEDSYIIPYEAQTANPSKLYALLKGSPEWENLGKLP